MRGVRVSVGCVLLALSMGEFAGPAGASATPYFQDEFDGSAIDETKWDTAVLNAGVRWCDPNPGYAQGPGSWFDPSSAYCYGSGQVPPYGSAQVSAGLLSFSGPASPKGFPYMSCGPPAKSSPIPPEGDFLLTLRVRFTSIGVCGDGITVLKWDNTTPSGTNAPGIQDDVVFQVWAHGDFILLSESVSGTYRAIPVTVDRPLEFHEYSLDYAGGRYTYLVDGVPVHGPIASTLRPNAVWVGNPVFAYWISCNWSSFELDYLRVQASEPTRLYGQSWGAVKLLYR